MKSEFRAMQAAIQWPILTRLDDSTLWGHACFLRAQSFSSVRSRYHPLSIQHDLVTPAKGPLNLCRPGHEINAPLASLWALDSDFILNY